MKTFKEDIKKASRAHLLIKISVSCVKNACTTDKQKINLTCRKKRIQMTFHG